MVTFLSGGTGTPKLLDGADAAFDAAETTVVANTGDDVEMGGLLVCPDVDTLLYQGGGVLDRETWWGIQGDTHRTHDALTELGDRIGVDAEPDYLPEERQTTGRDIARWRRFSGVPEFMTLGDRDRAVHVARTSLLDQGHSLSAVTERLAGAFGFQLDLLPMSDDPVATIVHTPDGEMHFQEFWVARNGDPAVEEVEYRGIADADPAPGVLDALEDPVVVGPSNPVTSIGPMLDLPGVSDKLAETTVIAVSPFVGSDAFSGPVAKLMEASGLPPSTRGVVEAYPFLDGIVVDSEDDTDLSVPAARTDISIDEPADAQRVTTAVAKLIEVL